MYFFFTVVVYSTVKEHSPIAGPGPTPCFPQFSQFFVGVLLHSSCLLWNKSLINTVLQSYIVKVLFLSLYIKVSFIFEQNTFMGMFRCPPTTDAPCNRGSFGFGGVNTWMPCKGVRPKLRKVPSVFPRVLVLLWFNGSMFSNHRSSLLQELLKI